MSRRRRAVAVAAMVALAGCAATTLDSSGTTAPSGGPTTMLSAPTGSATELLPQLDAELAALSERIVANEGDDEALARIDALWAAVRPEVATAQPALLTDFDGVIRLATTAVERRRPADADKARNNLVTLVTAYAGS